MAEKKYLRLQAGLGVAADEEDIEEQAEAAVDKGQEHDPASSQARPLAQIGLAIGVFVPHTSDRKTSSKPVTNLLSRSWIRSFGRRLAWPSSQLRLRACWVTQAAVGRSVQPARKTRREASSMKNNTYSCFNQTVSTVKKSQASTAPAWARRNRWQLSPARRGAGGTR